MSDPAQVLREFTPSKEFFVGIDSDGCVFDSMEIKPVSYTHLTLPTICSV